jgi:hypothetical protein
MNAGEMAVEYTRSPRLSAVLDRKDAWELLGDFDALMEGADQSLEATDNQSEAARIARGIQGPSSLARTATGSSSWMTSWNALVIHFGFLTGLSSGQERRLWRPFCVDCLPCERSVPFGAVPRDPSNAVRRGHYHGRTQTFDPFQLLTMIIFNETIERATITRARD